MKMTRTTFQTRDGELEYSYPLNQEVAPWFAGDNAVGVLRRVPLSNERSEIVWDFLAIVDGGQLTVRAVSEDRFDALVKKYVRNMPTAVKA